jgi:hypothetical protein
MIQVRKESCNRIRHKRVGRMERYLRGRINRSGDKFDLRLREKSRLLFTLQWQFNRTQ